MTIKETPKLTTFIDPKTIFTDVGDTDAVDAIRYAMESASKKMSESMERVLYTSPKEFEELRGMADVESRRREIEKDRGSIRSQVKSALDFLESNMDLLHYQELRDLKRQVNNMITKKVKSKQPEDNGFLDELGKI